MVCDQRIESLFDASAIIKKHHNEYNGDEDKLLHMEGLLRDWASYQTHLPKNYERVVARNYIRGSKYNLEVAKKKFEGYFLAKYTYPEIYGNRDVEGRDVETSLDSVKILWFPRLTPEGDRIVFFSINRADPTDFCMTKVAKVFLMFYDLLLTSDSFCSEIVVLDAKHFSPSHFVKFVVPAFKNLMVVLREAYAMRIKHIHVINAPPIIEKMVSMVSPFLHRKLVDRFTFHRGFASLSDHLDASLLPRDLNGHLQETTDDLMCNWRTILAQNGAWFKGQDDVKLVGVPPPGKRKSGGRSLEDISMEGSFRQLNID